MVALVVSNLGSIAQTKEPWPDGIPGSFREQLVVRLKQYIEFERGSQFGNQYDLLDKASVSRSRDDYVAGRRRSQRLTRFEPRSVSCSKSPVACRIEGLADLQREDEIPIRCDVAIDAKLQRNEWFLSEWLAADDCFPGLEKLTTTSPEITVTPDPKKKQKP